MKTWEKASLAVALPYTPKPFFMERHREATERQEPPERLDPYDPLVSVSIVVPLVSVLIVVPLVSVLIALP